MKRLKTILLNLLLALVIPASLSAQTDAERKFLASADSLNTQLLNAYTGKDYPATEALCQKVIDLYDAHASQLAEGYAYFKYSSYYTMASVQAIQGKKQEAVSNLCKALNSNKMEVSYKRVVNDEDLKDILDAPELQPALIPLYPAKCAGIHPHAASRQPAPNCLCAGRRARLEASP